jgi:hypothetical protein
MCGSKAHPLYLMLLSKLQVNGYCQSPLGHLPTSDQGTEKPCVRILAATTRAPLKALFDLEQETE